MNIPSYRHLSMKIQAVSFLKISTDEWLRLLTWTESTSPIQTHYSFEFWVHCFCGIRPWEFAFTIRLYQVTGLLYRPLLWRIRWCSLIRDWLSVQKERTFKKQKHHDNQNLRSCNLFHQLVHSLNQNWITKSGCFWIHRRSIFTEHYSILSELGEKG